MIAELTSGECRAIGRPDLHVYCHHPMVETLMPNGRMGWRRMAGTARYCVVCPDAGLDYLPYDQWMTAAQATAVVDQLTRAEARP